MRRKFTANVSHELKTPLQGILGSAELLQSGMIKPEDTARFVRHIHEEATRLLALIGDIIRLSQLDEAAEGGELSGMTRESVDLCAVSTEVIKELVDAAAKRNVIFTLSGGSVMVFGVRRLVYKVIYNLCDNAIRYNRDNGSVTVAVSAADGMGVVSVADTGIGIAPENWDRIFERFYRVEKSHSHATGGTGLGLSIVKHAIQYLEESRSIPSPASDPRLRYPCHRRTRDAQIHKITLESDTKSCYTILRRDSVQTDLRRSFYAEVSKS